MKKLLLLIALSLGLIYQEYHLRQVSLKEGEMRYKASNRIYMAFKSAYHYGYMDCSEGRPEDWDGESQ